MKPSRVLLIAILGTAAMYIGSFAVLGDSFPTINSTGEEVIAWFTANARAAQTYAWCAAFISLGLCIVGGQVGALLPRTHAYIFLGGMFGWAVTAQVQAWFWAALAFRPAELSSAAAAVVFDIPAYWGPLVNGFSAAMSIPFVVLGLGSSSLVPRWVGWLSLIFFVEQSIETITVFGQTGFLAPGGAMNLYVGGVIGYVWFGGVIRWAMKELDAQAVAA
ncbi:MAG: hypothetical protein AAF997_17100 [Myxococcota bacterium]